MAPQADIPGSAGSDSGPGIFTVVLTGGIASGKTAVSARFAAHGVTVIDTDRIAHEIVEPGQPALREIVQEFGPAVLGSSGKLDRARMRTAVFSSPTLRVRLEAILHPRIAAEARKRVDMAVGPYCLVVVPLYAESARWQWIDRVLVVDVGGSVQIERVMKRDGIDRDQASAILRSQANRSERIALADDVIDNSGRLEDLQAQVEMLHAKYLALSSTRQEPKTEDGRFHDVV
jgi:dephospho-CoA kinase